MKTLLILILVGMAFYYGIAQPFLRFIGATFITLGTL